MKKIILLMIVILLNVSVIYAKETLELKNIDDNEFEYFEIKIENSIGKDKKDDLSSIINNDQSFDLFINNVKKFRLIPVSFVSRKARNRVCILSYFSDNNEFVDNLNIGYISREEDEITGSCQGINAVSVESINDKKFLLYIISNRVANHYENYTTVVTINSRDIQLDEELSSCINNNKIDSIAKARKAIKKCYHDKRIKN